MRQVWILLPTRCPGDINAWYQPAQAIWIHHHEECLKHIYLASGKQFGGECNKVRAQSCSSSSHNLSPGLHQGYLYRGCKMRSLVIKVWWGQVLKLISVERLAKSKYDIIKESQTATPATPCSPSTQEKERLMWLQEDLARRSVKLLNSEMWWKLCCFGHLTDWTMY